MEAKINIFREECGCKPYYFPGKNSKFILGVSYLYSKRIDFKLFNFIFRKYHRLQWKRNEMY